MACCTVLSCFWLAASHSIRPAARARGAQDNYGLQRFNHHTSGYAQLAPACSLCLDMAWLFRCTLCPAGTKLCTPAHDMRSASSNNLFLSKHCFLPCCFPLARAAHLSSRAPCQPRTSPFPSPLPRTLSRHAHRHASGQVCDASG
jgi:hypothetical protein